MNIVNHSIEIQCSQKNVSEIAQVLLHSIIFFRSHGKFNYSQTNSFSIGSVGYEVIQCEQLKINYVRYTCPSLVHKIDSKIQEFVDSLTQTTQTAILSLEFYKQRTTSWPFNDPKLIWELWNIKFVIKQNSSTLPLQPNFMNNDLNKLENVLRDKIIDIVRLVNSDKSATPSMPARADLASIFDTSHHELQPYLHSISYKITESLAGTNYGASGSKGNIESKNDSQKTSSIRKFIRETLEL